MYQQSSITNYNNYSETQFQCEYMLLNRRETNVTKCNDKVTTFQQRLIALLNIRSIFDVIYIILQNFKSVKNSSVWIIYNNSMIKHIWESAWRNLEWHVRPAKTQISLGFRPVWSESSLSAWRKLGSLAT